MSKEVTLSERLKSILDSRKCSIKDMQRESQQFHPEGKQIEYRKLLMWVNGQWKNPTIHHPDTIALNKWMERYESHGATASV